MKITKQFEFIDEAACKAIARIDLAAGIVSDDTMYPTANATTYYVLINTWLNLVSELSNENSYNLAGSIRRNGLIQVIKLCQKCSDHIIQSLDECNGFDVPEEALFMLNGCTDLTMALMLLRFPKRFSPLKANLVEKSSISAFLNVNNEMKQKQHYEPNRMIIRYIKPIIKDMLKGFSFEASDGYFSAGAFVPRPGSPGDNTLVNKVLSWADVNWFSPLYPANKSYQESDLDFQTALVKAVPKSYKAARIIAKENSYRQWHMQAIRVALEKCVKDNGYNLYLDYSNQGYNQFYCYLGSVSNMYATADLSAASDRISCALMRELLPAEVLKLTDKYRSNYFKVNGRRYTTQMYNTSGAALTFALESIVFTAIIIAVTRFVSLHTGKLYSVPRDFGDDMLVDPEVYDTLCEWLTSLGLVINYEKSYTNPGRYRESCGVEFFDGTELTQFYFPRKALDFSKEREALAIQSLVELEHRLYDHWSARSFLIEVVRNLYPKMTSSFPLSDNSDLWEPYPIYQTKYIVPGKDYTARELHSSLIAKYDALSPSEMNKVSEQLDMYYYMSFLRQGPLYLTDLDRVLGVSEKIRNYRRDTHAPTYQWSIRR